jgi:hypothetical protein
VQLVARGTLDPESLVRSQAPQPKIFVSPKRMSSEAIGKFNA